MITNTNSTEIGLDYKQFAREFERYRLQHPEVSLQQALEAFSDSKNGEKATALV